MFYKIEMNSIDQLVRSIRKLMELPLENLEDEIEWNNQAEIVEVELRTHSSEIDEKDSHQIQHFLDDADIRRKDKEYKEVQESEIRKVISKHANNTAEQSS